MSRYFNGQEVELLAPAGNFEIFKEIVKTGADAIYFGGKNYNMRMHRKDFNFTDEEIKAAIQMAHEVDKKVYIVVNNLMSEEELITLEAYLCFLNEVQPDALIVQDVGIIELIKRLGLNLTIHASIMMNIHNLSSIEALRQLGVTRVVASRELSLAQIQKLHLQTDMEFEYFVHGDMCIAHGSQCTYSGILFGQSGNRGRCMKPCRWGYQMKQNNQFYDTAFPLAVKDMAMYNHIPELIDAGVVSFKIEGRMRSTDYLLTIINAYSEAIDDYIKDPIGFERGKDYQKIEANRNRDLSTAYAFGKPGLKNINRRYEGTGKFYSTGKVFSKATEERTLSTERIEEVKNCLIQEVATSQERPALAVRVNSINAAQMAIEEGCDIIYLQAQPYQPNAAMKIEEIQNLSQMKGNSKIYLAMPRMMYEEDFKLFDQYFKNDLGLDGLLVTEMGVMHRYGHLGYEMIGDYSLNLYNGKMAAFYGKMGMSRGTVSIESTLENTKEMLNSSQVPLEIIVHGRPAVMYIEHDLYENTKAYEGIEIDENIRKKDILYLLDEKGFEHPVYKDIKGRNHLLLSKALCYLPILPELHAVGAKVFRIEGLDYEISELRALVKLYKKALLQMSARDEVHQETFSFDVEKCMERLIEINGEEQYTLGSLHFN